MFDQLEADLHQAGFGTLVWDVRGHGLSSMPSLTFRVGDVVDDLIRILDREGVAAPVVLVGQSMGGNVSQELLRWQPGRVAALVAIGSTCNTMAISRWERTELRLAGQSLRLIPFKYLTSLMARASSTTTSGQTYLLDVFRSGGRRRFLRIWAGVSRCLTPDLSYRAPVPQLLIVGQHDETGNIKTAMLQWSDRDPRSELLVVRGAGHVAQLDRPDQVNQAVIKFIRENVS
jgi:3-oxoadipate enol-lactonase